MNIVCPDCKKKFPIDFPLGSRITLICDACNTHIDSVVKSTFGFRHCSDTKRKVQPDVKL